jgi:ABC-2 type transport system ATP-binding protein
VRGRIAPLIAVGVGFHPELTGRENVYVNGTILGMTRPEIDRRFDEIVEFAEIERFIDTPVKFYSSGMFVRLGFSVAIQADPDVLLVDEVLAVGDVAFQWKCFDRMMEIRRSGSTVAVVSHNLNAVRKLCDRTVVLHNGAVSFHGGTNEAIARYHDLIGEERDEDGEEAFEWRSARLEGFELLDASGRPTGHVEAGDEVVFRVTTRFDETIEDPIYGFTLTNEKGVNVYSDSRIAAGRGTFHHGDRLVTEVRVRLALATGSYQAQMGVTANDRKTRLDRTKPVAFYVAGRGTVHGVVDLEAHFDIDRVVDAPEAPGAGEALPG